MYLLYLDESGFTGDPNQQYFVLGGVCVPERSIHWLSSKLDVIASDIDQGDPTRVEFHASEIFGGRTPPWSTCHKQQRIDIIKRVLNSLQEANSDTRMSSF